MNWFFFFCGGWTVINLVCLQGKSCFLNLKLPAHLMLNTHKKLKMDYTCELEGTSFGCSEVANHSCRSLFQLVAHIDDRSNPYPFQHFLTRHVDMDRFGICYLITEKATKLRI